MSQRAISLTTLAILLCVSLAEAQGPRGGGGGGRGGFGRGGFGGPGFGGPGGLAGPTVSLLNMPEILKELGTTSDQNKAIEELSQQTQDQMRESFGNFRDLQDLSDEERQQRMEESRKKMATISSESNEKLAKLLEPKQLERLGQIKLQREGVAALSRPDTAKSVGLSEEQVAKIRQLQPEQRPGERISREDREKAQTDTLALLTDEQKTKWAELQGKKFDFPEPRGFGGGGGFGGGRGGPGGGRGGDGGGFGGGGGLGGGRGRGQNEERVRPPSKKD